MAGKAEARMLVFFSILIMVIVALAGSRAGIFAALTRFINVILSGILAFQFWEPVADELDVLFSGGPLAGYEDAFVLTALFALALVLLRMASERLAPKAAAFSGYVQQAGGGAVGLATGYLVAGFVVCVLETLPWHENFLGFQPRTPAESGWRQTMPPDRIWLALMRHAGSLPLAWKQ